MLIINIAVIAGLEVISGLVFGKAHVGLGTLIWVVVSIAYLGIPKVRTGQTVGSWS